MLDCKDKKIILGSSSPRRQELMSLMDINFEVKIADYEEHFSPDDSPVYTAIQMSIGKNNALRKLCNNNEIIITADTIVSINNIILGKPRSLQEAKQMLEMLSGNCHVVVTGVCISDSSKKETFHAETQVYIKKLSKEEIDYYTSNYEVMDKAGAYGIQEWFGVIGIEKICGPYFNVMGLPTQMLYEQLQKFI